MAVPRRGYFLRDGTRVPGATTIIGRFKESGPLLRWAYAQGRTHESLLNQGKEAPTSLYDEEESAANIGTVTHAMVEAHLNGENEKSIANQIRDAYGTRLLAKAKSSYDAYLSWEQQSRLKIVAQEIPLVSEAHRFGGRPDAIGSINGQICIIDWKTSNRVYTDHLIQLAAYSNLVTEGLRAETYKPLGFDVSGGCHICRFAKTNGDFAHHFYPNLSEAWRQFVLFREAYDIDKQLKKRAA